MSSGLAVKDTSFAPGAGEILAGHYRVERVLGTGGMGVVLEAADLRNGEHVAIKLLRAAEEQRAVDRFFREARAMSRLSTEHVVRVHEAGFAENNRPYLVMERLDGKDFAEQARGGRRLPMRDVVDATIQACEALSHAHRAGIVHRDLKPSNLFLHVLPDGRQVVKLLDFGISKVKSKDEWEKTLTATNDGGVLGSPPYMSPEQVRDPKKVDARSDVWALGIVMYKLLAGKLPFDGDSVGEVFARVLERPYPSLRTWGGVDVPPELDAIVGKCLAKDRRDRFQHTGELALALSVFASPPWAELAHRVALRLKDDPPTVEEAGEQAVSNGPPSEPSTLTLEDSLSGYSGVPAPVAPTPFEMTPQSLVAAMPHPPIGVGTPGSGVTALGPFVNPRPGNVPSASMTFGPAVMDPQLRAEGATKRPSRAAAIAAVIGGAVIVVAVGLGFGLRGRHANANASPSATASAVASASASSGAGAGAGAIASSGPSAVASVSAPSGTGTGTGTGTGGTAATGGTAKVPRTGGGRRPAPPATTTTTAAPPATARPELHPNPYGN